MLMFLLKCLASTVIVFSSADLISQRDMTESVCENGTVNIVAANEPIPETFKRIVWTYNNNTTFDITSSECTKTKNTSNFGRHISVWSNCTGLTIVKAKLNDQGNFTRVITLENGTDVTSERILYVKELTTRNFSITFLNRTLRCGESIGTESTYIWMFSKNAEIKNKATTGHELPLLSITQKGSVYCQRHSDCTSSFKYSFSSGEVPKGGGIHTAAVVVPIVVIIITIIIIVVIVIILYKRKRKGERTREAAGGENASEQQML